MKKTLKPTNMLRNAKIASFISDMLTNRSILLSLFDAAVAASVFCFSMSLCIRLSFPYDNQNIFQDDGTPEYTTSEQPPKSKRRQPVREELGEDRYHLDSSPSYNTYRTALRKSWLRGESSCWGARGNHNIAVSLLDRTTTCLKTVANLWCNTKSYESTGRWNLTWSMDNVQWSVNQRAKGFLGTSNYRGFLSTRSTWIACVKKIRSVSWPSPTREPRYAGTYRNYWNRVLIFWIVSHFRRDCHKIANRTIFPSHHDHRYRT